MMKSQIHEYQIRHKLSLMYRIKVDHLAFDIRLAEMQYTNTAYAP